MASLNEDEKRQREEARIKNLIQNLRFADQNERTSLSNNETEPPLFNTDFFEEKKSRPVVDAKLVKRASERAIAENRDVIEVLEEEIAKEALADFKRESGQS